ASTQGEGEDEALNWLAAFLNALPKVGSVSPNAPTTISLIANHYFSVFVGTQTVAHKWITGNTSPLSPANDAENPAFEG
ncbi:MAG: hypothetical protein NWR72_18025, partial [Bacteroidia bacterium]|nr:hypothetical protein [Bacteroidia bacterium]